MNFFISSGKEKLSNHLYNIFDLWQQRYKKKLERQKRYQARLCKPISDMRYLEHVVIVEGCRYMVGKKNFPTLEKALMYCRKIPLEKTSKKLCTNCKNTIQICIQNPNAPSLFNPEWIPDGLLCKDTKDALCIYAAERCIVIAADLSEVYTEYFELGLDHQSSYEHIYDYGVLYGNYPVYTGTELCVSRVTPDYCYGIEHISFVPEPKNFGLASPNAIYDCLREVYMAYDCYYIELKDDGSVYDDGDGGFPFEAIPVSTFVNIGKAGVYWNCWDKIWGNRNQTDLRYVADGIEVGTETRYFRFALMACKEHELPQGKAYHIIEVLDHDADGLLPLNFPPCTYIESREKLVMHAPKRTVAISPAFDEVYWEEFTLRDKAGETIHFCYDYGLLSHNPLSIQIGELYQTNYWNKLKLGNPLTDAKIVVKNFINPEEIYYGQGNVNLCCVAELADESTRIERIPISTLQLFRPSND